MASPPAVPAPGPAPARSAPASGLDPTGFDLSVRPQDNLYAFAAAAWLRSTRIPEDLSDYGTFTALDENAQQQQRALLEQTVRSQASPGSAARKAADFYESCMDVERVEQRALTGLAGELDRIDALREARELGAYFGHAQRLGIPMPLNWSAPQDPGDAQAYISEFSQGGLSMPDRDYYLLEQPEYRAYRAKLQHYVASLLGAAGSPEAAAAEQAARIVGLETRLAQAHWSKVDNRDPIKTYNKHSLAQAQALAAAIDWDAMLAALGAPAQPFVLTQPSFVRTLAVLIEQLSMSEWRAYLRFRLLDAYAPFLPQRFDALHFEFHQRTLSGVQQQRVRWKRALGTLNACIGEIVGELYVARHFPPQAKQRVRQLVDHLLQAFERSIDELDWMSPATRTQARHKLSRISVKIGYPEVWRDYGALHIDAEDLLGNVMRAAQFEQQRQVRRLGGPIDRGEWHMTPQTVNAYYQPSMNEIVFPAAILQPPFYDPAADDAVNYGGIGAVIGHEISHGFDDQGRQFDADGNLRDWWLPADAERFQTRTRELIAQYAHYRVLDGVSVNGELTLGENIADLSGVAIAYKAYLIGLAGAAAPEIDGFSGAQRFFLGWAQIWRRKYRDDNLRMRILTDPHSPSEFRVSGPLSNNDAFHAAFAVGEADQMYRAPSERVKIW